MTHRHESPSPPSATPSGWARWSSFVASFVAGWAGFCGAMPFGMLLGVILAAIEGGFLRSDLANAELSEIIRLLVALMGLTPCLIATTAIHPRDWPRFLAVLAGGLAAGGLLGITVLFAFILVMPVTGLGLVLGLATVLPCWRTGDAAGRALALLGLTPGAIALLWSWVNPATKSPQVDPVFGWGLTAPQAQYLLIILLLVVHLAVAGWVAAAVKGRFDASQLP